MRSIAFLRLLVLTSSIGVGTEPFLISKSSLLAADAAPKNVPQVKTAQPMAKSPEGLPVHSFHIYVTEVSENKVELPSDNAIVRNLKTRERQPFSQVEFDQDLKILAREFDKVEPLVKVKGNEVDVEITAWKKPLVREITFQGNIAFNEKKLLKEAEFQKDTLLDRQLFYKGVQKIRALYVKKGYFEVDIHPDIKETAPGVVDIVININEGRAGFIEKLRFHNFSDKEEDEIRDRMMTKEYSFFLSWMNNQGTYYSDIFRQDELQILSYLQNMGYLDAKVSTSVTAAQDKKDRIIVDIYADRGEMYYLGEIHFEGSQNIVSNEDLLKKTGLVPGKPYSPDAIRYAVRSLYSAFGSKGYIDTAVVPENKLVQSKDGKRVYDVTFKIQQGKCYRVGLIRIIGNTKTQAKVILHETPLIPGSVFDSTMLAKTEERLRNIGYFRSVNVYATRSDQQSVDMIPFRDVHIEVEENPTTAQFSAFGGYNTTESVSGGVNFAETNFNMEGITDILTKGFRAVRGGGEYFGVTATIGTKQKSYTLSWTKPYFFDSKWAFGIDLSKQDNEFAASDYAIKSKEMTLSLKRPINAFVNVGTHYRLRDGHIDLKGVEDKSKNKQLIRESKNGGVISAVGASINYDSTNHPVNPSSGVRSSLSLEYAGLFGDHHFATFGYLNTLYFPVAQEGVLKFRGNLQLIQPLFGTKAKRLPLDERLYLGGEGSVRGYRYNAIGPLFTDKYHTPRGGMTSAFVSGEYEHKLYKSLHGFTFIDAGNVWWRTLQFGNLRYSAGFGIKYYMTETTPLTVGFGFPLNPKKSRDVRRFYFSIGTSF